MFGDENSRSVLDELLHESSKTLLALEGNRLNIDLLSIDNPFSAEVTNMNSLSVDHRS